MNTKIIRTRPSFYTWAEEVDQIICDSLETEKNEVESNYADMYLAGFTPFAAARKALDRDFNRRFRDELASDDILEARAEMASERSARNTLSHDQESYDEMVRDDLEGRS